jgi:hypothetical protein
MNEGIRNPPIGNVKLDPPDIGAAALPWVLPSAH